MTPVTAPSAPAPPAMPTAPTFAVAPAGVYLRKFTVAEYHKMIDAGILTEDDSLELIEGWLRCKMPHDPRHDSRLNYTRRAVERLLTSAWIARIQCSITLDDSEPEPDIVVAAAPEEQYDERHPENSDIGLIVEVSNSSLSFDRNEKAQMYARAGIPNYWIVNVVDGLVECRTDPTGPAPTPTYRQQQDYRPGDSIPLVLGGQSLGDIDVNEIKL